MKPILAACLGTAVLAGCASQPRTQAPAPVESARDRVPVQAAPTPKTEPREESTVEVYAYRPPSGAADAPPSSPLVEDDSGSVGSLAALPSESATPPAPGPDATAAGESAASAGAPPPPAQPLVAYAAPAPPAPELQPAAAALAAQAEQQRQAGDHVGAAATLERALRIQPQEAYLWNRLARVRMEQGRYAQAGNFAQRSNTLAKDQPTLKQDNWGMIAVSRRTKGDVAGAMEAEEKARGG